MMHSELSSNCNLWLWLSKAINKKNQNNLVMLLYLDDLCNRKMLPNIYFYGNFWLSVLSKGRKLGRISMSLLLLHNTNVYTIVKLLADQRKKVSIHVIYSNFESSKTFYPRRNISFLFFPDK